jgi:hypothetical protein
MNIQDRIAKLETQICQSIDELTKLKEDTRLDNKENTWHPRQGEIVEMSDEGVGWFIRRYGRQTDFNYEDTLGERFVMCRPLDDPMVIQLIPHTPGDPRPPFGDAQRLIVAFENGEYDVSYSHNVGWGNNYEGYNVIGWIDIDKQEHE